jgi:hypothetical protein
VPTIAGVNHNQRSQYIEHDERHRAAQRDQGGRE